MIHSKISGLANYIKLAVGSGKITHDEGDLLIKELRSLVNAINRNDRKDAIRKINSFTQILLEMLT